MIRSGPRPPVVASPVEDVLEEYGIYAPCQLSVDVESADLIGRGKKDDRYYQLSCRQVLPHRKDTQGGEKLEHHKSSLACARKTGYAGAFKPDKNRKPFAFTLLLHSGNLIHSRNMLERISSMDSS